MLKPQDIIILLKLELSKYEQSLSLSMLSEQIGISPSEIHFGMKRAIKSGLLDPLSYKPINSSLREFIIHGLRYAFPADVGPVVRGIPTAHSAPPLSHLLYSSNESGNVYVWPFALGKNLGQAVTPLYKSAPAVASRNPEMYEFLALIDAIRLGQARERKLAVEEINRLLKPR